MKSVLPVVAVLGLVERAVGWCRTNEPSQDVYDFAAKLQILERNQLSARQSSNITVPVYMHVVLAEGKEDLVTDGQMQEQFDVLVRSYTPHDISFTFEGLTRTINTTLASGPLGQGPEFQDFIKETRRGDYATLNIYYHSEMTNGTYGICNLPAIGGDQEPYIWNDPCHINAGTVPSGYLEGHNLGLTTVHEVGHWFGLFHTFQGSSCNPLAGDMVDDTPQESTASSGCPEGKDSCPDQPGLDPIHNYMDYSDDACTTEFTPGQRERMHNMFESIRVG